MYILYITLLSRNFFFFFAPFKESENAEFHNLLFLQEVKSVSISFDIQIETFESKDYGIELNRTEQESLYLSH